MQGLKVEVLPSTFEENLDKSAFANPGGSCIEVGEFFLGFFIFSERNGLA